MCAKVIIHSINVPEKLKLVKSLQKLTGWGLIESKNFVDSIPATTPDLAPEVAKEVAKLFASFGANFDLVGAVINKPKSADSSAAVGNRDIDELRALISQQGNLIASLNSRIDALEAKIGKTGSVPEGTGQTQQNREVIVAHKKVRNGGANNDYFKTSKGRVLLDCSPRYGMDTPQYSNALKNILIGLNDNMAQMPGESLETFVARVRAKYAGDPVLPTLLGGHVLMLSGALWTVTPTNRSIKF